MHDKMRAWKILRLKGIITGRLGYNFKSHLPVCTSNLFYFKKHCSKKNAMNCKSSIKYYICFYYLLKPKISCSTQSNILKQSFLDTSENGFNLLLKHCMFHLFHPTVIINFQYFALLSVSP